MKADNHTPLSQPTKPPVERNIVDQASPNLSDMIHSENMEDSERYPKSNRLLTAIILSFMGLFVYAFDFVMAKLGETIAVPYSYVLEFYNLTLLIPAQTFPKVWGWLDNLHLTTNSDINLGISCAGIFMYWAVVLWFYAVWVEIVGIFIARLGNYDRPDISGAFKLYLLPALVFLLFFLMINVFLLYWELGF